MFERFKDKIKEKTTEQLKEMLIERQKELFKWKQPVERAVEVGSEGKHLKQFTKHPYYKVRKEIAILKTAINQRK